MNEQRIDVDALHGRETCARDDARAGREKDPVHRRQVRVPAVHPSGRRRGSPNLNRGTLVGDDDDVADAWARAIVEAGGHLLPEIGSRVAQSLVQRVTHLGAARHVGDMEAYRESRRDRTDAVQIHQLRERVPPLRVEGCHAVIRDDHEDDAGTVWQRGDPVHQLAQQAVRCFDTSTHPGRVRADRVPGRVDQREVQAGFKGSSQHVLAGVRVAVR